MILTITRALLKQNRSVVLLMTSLAMVCAAPATYAITPCESTLHKTSAMMLGSLNESKSLSTLLVRAGFAESAAQQLSTTSSNSGFYRQIIHYMTDPKIATNMEKFEVFTKWESFKRGDTYYKLVHSKESISFSSLLKMAAELLNVVPKEVKGALPPHIQHVMKLVNLAPEGTVKPELLLNLVSPTFGNGALNKLASSPLFDIALSFVPQQIQDQARSALDQTVQEALNVAKETLGTAEGSNQLQDELRKILVDFDIAMTWAHQAPTLAANEAFQITLPANPKETLLELKNLRLGPTDSEKTISGAFPLGLSQFHILSTQGSGRTYLFDTIEAKSVMATLGMPTIQVSSSNSQTVTLHVVRGLNLKQANEWFKGLFQILKEDPSGYHLVLVDDIRVDASVLLKLLSSLSKLPKNNSMIVSWNPIGTERLTSEEVMAFSDKARFYALQKRERGVQIEVNPTPFTSDTTEESFDDFDFN